MTRSRTIVARTATLGLALVLALWTAGHRATEAVSANAADAVTLGAAEPTIYALDIPLVDQHGRTLALTDLRGRPLVATMVYTSCTSVCPTIVERMKAIERRLPTALRSEVAFAMFSLDPGRDTPSARLEFATAHHLDDRTWRLFATTEDDVRTLSAVLGVKFKVEGDGNIAHSSAIVVIDRDGVARYRHVGMAEDLEPLVAAVARTVR